MSDVSETGPDAEAGENADDEKILSDDEMGALLDGMASGEVEICSATGPKLGSVSVFNVPPRSRYIKNRLPNFDRIADRFADRLRVQTQQSFKCPTDVAPRLAEELAFEAVAERRLEPVVAVQFSAAPLKGSGALLLEPGLVAQIVEAYFGGHAELVDPEQRSGLTFGELRVATNFATLVLDVFKELWQPLETVEPAIEKVEQSAHLIDIAADVDAVVRIGFDFAFAESDAAMHLILPSSMIAAALPYLRGVDREENPAEDQRWQHCLRDGVCDVDVDLDAIVGDVTISLGELICLEPGDVIAIDNPRNAVLRAQGVPLVKARFGVHAGRNAVEALDWLNDN